MTDTLDIKGVLPMGLCEFKNIPFIATAFKKYM